MTGISRQIRPYQVYPLRLRRFCPSDTVRQGQQVLFPGCFFPGEIIPELFHAGRYLSVFQARLFEFLITPGDSPEIFPGITAGGIVVTGVI